MKRRLALLLVAALLFLITPSVHAQISGAGSVGCTGTPVTGTAWNSGTSNNTTQALLTNTGAIAALVELDQTTTLTGGAVTFQTAGDGSSGTYVNMPVAQVINPATNAQLTNPYTLVASTNQQFLILLQGASNLQLKLTTAITGTGAITPYVTALCVLPGFPPTLAATPFHVVGSTSTFNTVKSSAGNLFGGYVFNPNASTCYLIFYNASSPTIGTTGEVYGFGVIAGQGFVLPPSIIALANFSTAITIAGTTTDGGSTVCSTGMSTNLWYQ
jgi:hypothetical protein